MEIHSGLFLDQPVVSATELRFARSSPSAGWRRASLHSPMARRTHSYNGMVGGAGHLGTAVCQPLHQECPQLTAASGRTSERNAGTGNTLRKKIIKIIQERQATGVLFSSVNDTDDNKIILC